MRLKLELIFLFFDLDDEFSIYILLFRTLVGRWWALYQVVRTLLTLLQTAAPMVFPHHPTNIPSNHRNLT